MGKILIFLLIFLSVFSKAEARTQRTRVGLGRSKLKYFEKIGSGIESSQDGDLNFLSIEFENKDFEVCFSSDFGDINYLGTDSEGGKIEFKNFQYLIDLNIKKQFEIDFFSVNFGANYQFWNRDLKYYRELYESVSGVYGLKIENEFIEIEFQKSIPIYSFVQVFDLKFSQKTDFEKVNLKFKINNNVSVEIQSELYNRSKSKPQKIGRSIFFEPESEKNINSIFINLKF